MFEFLSPVGDFFLRWVDSVYSLASALGLYRDHLAIERAERLKNAAPDGFIHYVESRRADVERKLARCNCPKKSIKRDSSIIGLLGAGSFGTVVAARWGDDERLVAIKIIRKKRLDGEKDYNYLVREKDIQWAVGGALVIELFAVSQDSRNVFMMFEYSPYGDLFRCTIGNEYWQPSEPRVKILAAQIVLGLEYLHEFKIMHRDLKPDNCILFGNGYLKLSDFGCARKLSYGRAFTMCGTLPYMAPEICGWLGYRSCVDWYAFGVMVFELLHRRWPFRTADRTLLQSMKEEAAYRFKGSLRLSQDVKNFIGGLLQPKPKMRLGNLAGRAEDVKNHPWFEGIDFDCLFKREYAIRIFCEPMEPAPTNSRVVFGGHYRRARNYPEF